MRATSRHKARVAAFQALYEADSSSHQPQECLRRIGQKHGLSPEAEQFATDLIEGVHAAQDTIDVLIGKAAPAYPVDQLSPIDRNILRLAIGEMLGDNGTPVRVAINEAVELAKQFGSESSARFVNGVLGHVARQHESSTRETSGRRG